ncbi:hypothetical protein GCM10022200_21760 [Microbacterium awajiense]|uniref:DUF2238 domain-containing protein n=1 Tax=Microbacterium awajiense TaxID=415214 RepID=A0ABP7AR93_9MICO
MATPSRPDAGAASARPPRSAFLRRSLLLALPFQAAMIVSAAVLLAIGYPAQLALALLLVPALWAPALLEVIARTSLPRPLQVHYILFIVAGPFMGSALHVYGWIPDWDTLVHFDSGVMLAWLGMLGVRRVEEHLGVALPVWFGLTVIQLTPMAFAAAWEICEFASDALLATTSQNGLEDTMLDIVAGTLGGLLAISLLILFRRPRTLAPHSLLVRADVRVQPQ